MQLSASRLKWLVSLQQKKFRTEHGMFIAEGKKLVSDLVQNGWTPELIVLEEGMEEFLPQDHSFDVHWADSIRMKKISTLSTPPGILGVFPIPHLSLKQATLESSRVLVLDGIADPGNMGTILRTAHWFGVREIFLDNNCTDPFAPKVVQATMGSLARVRLFYSFDQRELVEMFRRNNRDIRIADMVGTKVSDAVRKKNIALCMGSESHGISPFWKENADSAIVIPPVDPLDRPESLNVGVATAILLHHFSVAP